MHCIRITKENIDKEHICCAMSGKQSIVKKEWLKQRFENELVEEKRIWSKLFQTVPVTFRRSY